VTTVTRVMRMSKRFLLAGAGAALIMAVAAVGVVQADDGPRVGIWMDRDDGSVYRPGESVKVHVRPYEDCYVMIYEIDTDGYVRVLFPQDCSGDGYLEGGRTYLLGGGHRKFYVSGPEGVDYIHVLASYEPFRQVYWDGCDGYEQYAREATWSGFHDYWGSALPPRVYGDPYVAMETIDEFICQDALEDGLVWADFTYFYVGGHVDYPRYLCYDCHGFGGNVRPYSDVCLGFSISFVDCDPGWHPWSWWWWSSPRRVYCGPRYICHATEHYCSHGHGDGHTYPSEYKWKSRHDSADHNPVGGQVVERVRSGDRLQTGDRVRSDDRPRNEERSPAVDTSRRTASRSGNVIDATRYKSPERNAGGDTERDITNDVRTDDVKTDNNRVREERREDMKAGEPGGERTKSRSGTSIVKAALNSISRSITRSGKSSTDDTPKGKTPQVRQQGDKGKSQVTRRKLSR
jgi:hypothetical protein